MSRRRTRLLPFRIPFFRIFYSTTYTTLYIIELIFLAVTPTTLIFEAIRKQAFQYIIIVGAVYILVVLSVIFIYTSRLFTNRTVLAAVGKSWIPVEAGDVTKNVRRMIRDQLERSVVIAYEARPRDLTDSEANIFVQLGDDNRHELGKLVKVDPDCAPWGLVQHPGWSSPDPRETTVSPDVLFSQVMDELPNLLEARVVSLGAVSRLMPQEELDRTILLPLREYLEMIQAYGDISVPPCADDFLGLYDAARFSGRPLSEAEFVALSASFADLLAGLLSTREDETVPATNGGPKPPYHSPLQMIEDGASVSSDSRTSGIPSDSGSSVTRRSSAADSYVPAASSASHAAAARQSYGRVLHGQSMRTSAMMRPASLSRQTSSSTLQTAPESHP